MPTTESYTGANCTGSSGDTNRVLTLSNTRTTIGNGLIVIVANNALHPTTDFTVSHKSASSTITFVNSLWNDQNITVIYNVAGAEQGTAGASGIIPLDTQAINNEIDYFGSTVTIRAVTDDSYSKWGDPTESTSDNSNVKAMVQVLSQEDNLVKEGIFQNGDKVFWFKGNQGNISRGNRIQHSSKWYEITRVVEHTTADITYALEAQTKKV